MPHSVHKMPLVSVSPGTARHVLVHRFGTPGARPKIYLQAALHANEVPGIAVLHRLLRRLGAADEAGEVQGEVVVVPFANPIGLGDTVLGVHIGRYGLDTGSNFNRLFPELGTAAIPLLDGLEDGPPEQVVADVRAAFARVLAARTPRSELESLRLLLLGLAADADRVYDLHTEEDALFAAVLSPWVMDHADALVADMAPDLVFYADYPPLFDTACSRPWDVLRRHFAGRVAIPQGCLSATLELRGVASVERGQLERDADGLLRILRRCGSLAGDPGPAPPPVAPTRFEGVEFVRSPAAGVLVYHAALGERISAGQVLAELIDPADPDPTHPARFVHSSTDGVLFGRRHTLLVRPDDVVAKVAGDTPLADPKHY